MGTILRVVDRPDGYNITVCVSPPGLCHVSERLAHLEYSYPKRRGSLDEILAEIRVAEATRLRHAGPEGVEITSLTGTQL